MAFPTDSPAILAFALPDGLPSRPRPITVGSNSNNGASIIRNGSMYRVLKSTVRS